MTEIIALTTHGGLIPGKTYEVGEKLAQQLISFGRAKRPGDPDPKKPEEETPELPTTPPARRGRKPKS